MKRLLSNMGLIALAVLILACQNQESDSSSGAPEVRRYKIKSGIVVYKMSGAQSGTEILYFDNWGLIEAKHSQLEISMMGITRKENKVTILKGNKTYSYDPIKKTGTVIENSLMSEMSSTAKRKGKDMTDVGMEILQQMGGKKIGQEKIAGYLADVYEMKQLGTKTWVYNGVTLKTETKLAGVQINSTAIKAQFNVSIDKEKITVPSDVVFKDMSDFLENFKK